MTAVVSVQALVFQDGGILTLGANLFNMGVIGVSVAYASYTASARLLRRASWGLNAAGFVSGWFSIFIAALSCGLQLAWSGVSPARIVLPAMAGIHALIGLGEGLITAGALVFLSAARPALRDRARAGNRTNRGVFSAGILFSLLLIVLSPLASTQPDGLFWVAGQSGFLDKARSAVYQIFPNYSLPGFTNPALARVFAGTLGLVIVTAVTYGLARRGRRDVVKKPREVE
jgi:cobalt/nickel transport system permease protein